MSHTNQSHPKAAERYLKMVQRARLSEVVAERRSSSRGALVSLPAQYNLNRWWGGSWAPCTVLEISSNGIKLMMPIELKRGSHLKIRIKLPQAEKEVDIKIRVAWSAPSDIRPNFEVGASFVSTKRKDAKERLTLFIAERLCKSIVWLGAGIHVRPVETHDEATTVFGLIYKEYLKRSYCKPNDHGLYFCHQSLLPTTEMFIVQKDGNFMGGVSLIADSPAGLPAEHLYPEEVRRLRQEGRRMAEVGLLALKLEAFSKTFSLGDFQKMRCLFHLFKILYDYARHSTDTTDLIIHINPKHRMLYEFLTFEAIGPVRYYSDFQNKPAILMRMDIAKSTEAHSHPDSRCSNFTSTSLPAELLKKRFAWTDDHVRSLMEVDGMWEGLTPAAKEHLFRLYPTL